MGKPAALLMVCLAGGCSAGVPSRESAAAQTSGLRVTCSPNPCNQHAHRSVPRPPRQFMWFYRTEVRNTLAVPLRVHRFEVFTWCDGRWVASNFQGRGLTAEDFSAWYTAGDRIVQGEIPAGGVAVDACNWHGDDEPTGGPVKWAYWASDPEGKEHYAEVIVESVAIRR